MTISRLTGIKAIALGAALSMTAGLALAGDNVISADQIAKALQPKPLTRGLSSGAQQVDPAVVHPRLFERGAEAVQERHWWTRHRAVA